MADSVKKKFMKCSFCLKNLKAFRNKTGRSLSAIRAQAEDDDTAYFSVCNSISDIIDGREMQKVSDSSHDVDVDHNLKEGISCNSYYMSVWRSMHGIS